MRLTQEQIDTIRTLLTRRFGGGTRIWVFGSRTRDAAQGGDIDLYVEPGRRPEGNSFLIRQAARRELERQLRMPVDLLVNGGRTTAFMRLARQEGVPL